MQLDKEKAAEALMEPSEHDTLMALGFPARTSAGCTEPQPSKRLRSTGQFKARMREFAAEERGAVTAEYALIIMAAVAFAGLLITILRSDEVRSMLMNLVQNALGSAG